MTKGRRNPRKTAGRLVIETLKHEKALSEETAKPVTVFKDLPLSSTLIAYTVANFMQDGIVIKTNEEKFYFSEENWTKFEKKFNRVYWILIIIPTLILAGLLIVTNLTR